MEKTVQYVDTLSIEGDDNIISYDTLELPKSVAKKAQELVAQMNLPRNLTKLPSFNELLRSRDFVRSGDPVLEYQILTAPFRSTRSEFKAKAGEYGFGSIIE